MTELFTTNEMRLLKLLLEDLKAEARLDTALDDEPETPLSRELEKWSPADESSLRKKLGFTEITKKRRITGR
jgi:hypothetical protein